VYLKRLELQGFKSFANKTALEFGTGVTCIVGPNGCGKTNVADSLRWVLGEHASRTLRARKTEDVIFAGSDKRAPVGMAEVSIALDNSGGWLPVDFSEVVVTRRAYRNGENEYFINHARVRLRDVVELFMRAEVGQNSYAFMGQGMVEQVLSLRPEDRRALIEEAADVRLYRTRLEEAQSRLKATRENLERVQLLVREIEPRITQLERQASRAVKYQDLARELAQNLHVWYAHQWQEVNAQLLAAMGDADQRAEDLSRLKSDAKACEDGLAQLRAAIDERRREIAAREERLRTLEDYARDLERRTTLDGERVRLLRERIEELDAELATLREDAAAQAQAAAPVDTSALEARLAEARAALEATRERLQAVEHDLQAAQRTAIASEQARERNETLAREFARGLEEAADRIARLRRESAASDEDRRKVIGEIAAWARGFARARADAFAAAADAERAERERARLAPLIEAQRAEHARAAEDVQGLRIRIETALARIALLEQLEVEPQAPDAGIRMVLEAGGVLKRETVPEDIELAGVVGLVGQILRVPPGLEKAIGAALADSLHAIVLERREYLRPVIDLLLEAQTDRATLFALDDVQEVRPLHLIKERGIIGVASGLVKCDNRYRRLVDTLLGRTVVVEDLAVAQRVVRRGMAAAVATLDGVLLRPVGSVSIGTSTGVQAAFVRQREVAEAPEELASLRAQLEAREQALAALTSEREETAKRADGLDRALDEARGRRARLELELAGQRAALATLRGRIASARSAAAASAAELRTLTVQRGRMEDERQAAERDARAAAGEEQAARERALALESERAALVEAAAEQAATVAQIDGALRSERQAGEGERLARERIERQIAAKDEQRAKSMEESQAIATRLHAAERELAAKRGEIEALRADLEPARRERAQLESRERSLTDDLAEANARVREAERALYDAENDVRIRREELQTLRESLEAEGFVTTPDGDVRPAPAPEPQPVAEGGLPTWLRSDDDGDAELPPIRGGSTINPTEVRDRIAELRAQIRALGPVNEQAATDYSESRERYDFLTTQMRDLSEAEAQLHDAIGELEQVIRERFRTTFRTVNREFERYFSAFFRGGTARLELGETDEQGLPGIEIVAQPPGKKLGSLALLSGGERSLTAVALLFALLQANPSPICVLDEVDAALDEANVGRFVEELRELSQRTQFIIITHNRRTIENADTIYGVSMGADSVSRVLSLKLADVRVDSD